jgi:hypothetical protein
MNRFVRFFSLSFLLVALTPLAISAQQKKISDDTVAAAANGPVAVIVQYNNDPSTPEETQLTVKHHGELRHRLHIINSHAATLRQADLQDLASERINQ